MASKSREFGGSRRSKFCNYIRLSPLIGNRFGYSFEKHLLVQNTLCLI